MTARGLTTVALAVSLCTGTTWAQNAPKGAPTVAAAKHGIHTFDWKVRIEEPDGSLSDLPIPNRNNGHMEFGAWTCMWKIQASTTKDGQLGEQYVMACDSVSDRAGVTTSMTCDKSRPVNVLDVTLGVGGTTQSILTESCTEIPAKDAVNWQGHVEGPGSITTTDQHGGTAVVYLWACNWKTHPSTAPQGDRYEIGCVTYLSNASVVVRAWCTEGMKPADEITWKLKIPGRLWPDATGKVVETEGVTYKVTASCSDGSPPAAALTSARPGSGSPKKQPTHAGPGDNPY